MMSYRGSLLVFLTAAAIGPAPVVAAHRVSLSISGKSAAREGHLGLIGDTLGFLGRADDADEDRKAPALRSNRGLAGEECGFLLQTDVFRLDVTPDQQHAAKPLGENDQWY